MEEIFPLRWTLNNNQLTLLSINERSRVIEYTIPVRFKGFLLYPKERKVFLGRCSFFVNHKRITFDILKDHEYDNCILYSILTGTKEDFDWYHYTFGGILPFWYDPIAAILDHNDLLKCTKWLNYFSNKISIVEKETIPPLNISSSDMKDLMNKMKLWKCPIYNIDTPDMYNFFCTFYRKKIHPEKKIIHKHIPNKDIFNALRITDTSYKEDLWKIIRHGILPLDINVSLYDIDQKTVVYETDYYIPITKEEFIIPPEHLERFIQQQCDELTFQELKDRLIYSKYFSENIK